uniref:Lens fiber membrane intrinsic protein-like n=1 Tax=Crassostrea virginica TaxID=6565 RepID=A0A8B8EHQ4_CRAVI|nr:lens fiber membrane intrinsic protein-like [Crassostrea virginica]
MTVKERLKEGIRAWGRAPRGLTWSFLFLMVIYGLFLAGICSDHWLESSIVLSGYDHRNQGLWRFCYGTLGTTCCGYINDVMYIEPFLHATRAFLAMSLLPQLFCLYFIWKGIQASSGYSGYKLGGGIAAGFSAFLITLAIIIYGGASQDETSTSLYSLSWSYALCVVSGLAYIPFGCFISYTDDYPDDADERF